jgi:hypothetical protein
MRRNSVASGGVFGIDRTGISGFGSFIICLVTLGCTFGISEALPPDSASIRVYNVDVPGKGVIGEPFSFAVSLGTIRDLRKDRMVFLHFRKDGHLYFVTDVWPEPPTSLWTLDVPVEVSVRRFEVPPDLPPGHYTLHAGVYGEMNEESRLRDDAVATVEMVAPSGKEAPADRKVMTSGVFRDKSGVPHRWYINHGHTLVWDGVPWFPVGGGYRIPGEWETFVKESTFLKQCGVVDLYLHFATDDTGQPEYPSNPEKFQKAVDWLDENGFRYGTQLTRLPLGGTGFYFGDCAIVPDITESGEQTVPAEGTGRAIYMVYNHTLRAVVAAGEIQKDGNSFRIQVDCSPGAKCELSVFMEKPSQGPYFWGGQLSEYRNRAVSFYRSIGFGPGLRFVIDPQFNRAGYHYSFVPSAPDFRSAFQEWLRERYSEANALNRAWAVLGGYTVSSFESAASMIPLRGIHERGMERGWLYDLETGQTHAIDSKRSQFWLDVTQFQGEANRDALNAVCDALRTVIDVPMVFMQSSDPDPAMVNDVWPPAGQDGIGVEAFGTGEPVAMMNALAGFAQAEQYRKTAWVVVTETGEAFYPSASKSDNPAPGYEDRLANMYATWNSLLAWGAKGIFHFMINSELQRADDTAQGGILLDAQQLEWMRAYRDILESAHQSLAEYRPNVYYWYPALVDPVAGLFACARKGESVDNPNGYGYRGMVARAHNGVFIVPSFSSDVDTPRLIAHLEDFPESVRYGEEIQSREGVTWIGFRRDLGSLPRVDEYYTGTFREADDGYLCQDLRPMSGSWILNRSAEGAVWNLRTRSRQILAREVRREEGFQPEYLDLGKDEAIDPWEQFSQDALGLEFLDLGEGMRGFLYERNGVPVGCLWSDHAEPVTVTLAVPADAPVRAWHPDGTEIAPEGELLKAQLTAATRERSTESPRNVVYVEGLKKQHLTPKEQAAQSLTVLQQCVAQIPGGTENRKLMGKLQEVAKLFDKGSWFVAKDKADRRIEEICSAYCPYIWLEGEEAVETNFNLRVVRAMLRASGNAFLGLDTSAPAPEDTGYFARYRFRAAEPGRYALWVRESYLDGASPCEWRIDDSGWNVGPTTLVPEDVRTISRWAPFDDERIHMAWYRYAIINIEAGRHIFEIRVTQPCSPGNQNPEIREGQFSRSVDAILFTGSSFTPAGAKRPRQIGGPPDAPTINLVANSSLERDSDRDGAPDGWMKVGDSPDARYRVTPVGQVRFSRIGISCLEIGADARDEGWQTQTVPVKAGDFYLCRLWTRAEGVEESNVCSLVWRDIDGRVLEEISVAGISGDHDWTEHRSKLRAPWAAKSVRLVCTGPPSGKIWFDDFVFAPVPPVIDTTAEAE